ncbi:MAG: carbonic anhydrase [Rhodoferax sp.]
MPSAPLARLQPSCPLRAIALAWACTCTVALGADSHAAPDKAAEPLPEPNVKAHSSSDPKAVGKQLREALGTQIAPNRRLTIISNAKSTAPVAGEGTPHPAASTAAHGTAPATTVRISPKPVRAAAKPAPAPAAPAPEQHGEVHWSYEGENGPTQWGQLKPEFNVCAIGKRQSPINIDEGQTLQGPAEPISFSYSASNATVTNNGHTVQVDVQGDNFITVRGISYRLLQFHFHTPSEEQVNSTRFPMVAHLVHKNDEGQLAVVGILLDAGLPNTLIDKVWTYMPLDAGDRVRMPREALNLNELLPSDQRYYQYIGSLTTPPCTEGVLWLVMKQPVQISRNQLRLFRQLYPFNARPVQPVNGRPVREGM